MDSQSKAILSRVSHLEKGASSESIYDDWAEKYDDDLIADFGYISPSIAAEALSELNATPDLSILDYGCGTGLVGMKLKEHGYRSIIGMDVSRGMLDKAAEKQCYKELIQADLTTQFELTDNTFDAALCIGAMGAGHIDKKHVPELIRPIKEGGLFIATINGMYFEPDQFGQYFQQLADDGIWRLIKMEEFNYMSKLVRPGWIVVAQLLKN